ncbi:hypothetical protein [Streptomyces sodiiphilus]|uniref:hypothetical protein n=1 Tax=Streptomyces sodiiphilus TaxID=226217 RepID=UPI0031D04AA0
MDDRGNAWLADGRGLACPAATLVDRAAWALSAGLGQPWLHKAGRDSDPLVLLTPEATARFGLPGHLADRRGLRFAEDHPVVRELLVQGCRRARGHLPVACSQT